MESVIIVVVKVLPFIFKGVKTMELTDLIISNNLGKDLLLSLWNTENTIPTVIEIYINEEDAYALYKVINEFFTKHLTATNLTVGHGYIFKFSNIDDNITLNIIDIIKNKEYRYGFENHNYSSDYCSKQIIAPKLRVIEEKLHSFFSRI